MSDLATYAALAEILGGATILVGVGFAYVEFMEFRRRRRAQVAAELFRRFAEPDFGRAITLVRHLPDGVTAEQLEAMDSEYEEAAQIVGMAFESMGLLVFRDMASFQMIQELTGGLLISTWRKLEVWIKATRESQNNPRFGEWVQWLAERLAEREGDMVPAYEAHADWRAGRG